MLVILIRQQPPESERIVCTTLSGERIEFVIVDVRQHGTVRVGVDAPPGVSVHRLEVQQAIERAKEAG